MSSLKLYFDKVSQPSRALLMFVRANKAVISCEEVPVSLLTGEHYKEEFAKINPFKKLPVISHDGFILTESVAILRYLCRAFPVPGHWYPPTDSRQMARIDEFMAWQHFNLRRQGFYYFRTIILDSRKNGGVVNAKDAAHFGGKFNGALDQIESIWLKDNRPFVAGEEISIADLLAANELEGTVVSGLQIRKTHPKLNDYLERVREQLNPHYDESLDVLKKVERVYRERGYFKQPQTDN